MLIKLTAEMIQQDIAGYRERISSAHDKLAKLPMSSVNRHERKKIQAKRHALEDEIAHVRKLIDIAHEAFDALEVLNAT